MGHLAGNPFGLGIQPQSLQSFTPLYGQASLGTGGIQPQQTLQILPQQLQQIQAIQQYQFQYLQQLMQVVPTQLQQIQVLVQSLIQQVQQLQQQWQPLAQSMGNPLGFGQLPQQFAGTASGQVM